MLTWPATKQGVTNRFKMKEYLSDRLRTVAASGQERNLIREYLQARILANLQRAGAMIPLAFHGGTALRFLYSSARYSEDLDFALEHKAAAYDFRAYLRLIQTELTAEGYAIDIKVSDQRVVHSAFLHFRGLFYEFGLSPHQSEVLSVKIEVDTNPPSGAVLTTSVVRRHMPLRLQHHDPASLLAGKLHALLQRSYTKGRDIYDLFWYLSDPDWPAPNLNLLNQALTQSGWTGEPLTAHNWRNIVAERLRTLAWERVITDVRPFLEQETSVHLLTLENLLRVLE